jgi:predicted O-methyltransferase YrrM
MKAPYTPELLLVVQLAIERILADGGDVFEYGSGFGTIWFAKMANTVSVEDDDEWYAEVRKALKRTKQKVDYHLVPTNEMAQVIDDYDLFDLILVDCEDSQRAPALERSMSHVKPGGWLILDDSHWPNMKQIQKQLSAWPWTVIAGKHTRHWDHHGKVRDHQTSMYRRPL